MSDPIRELPDRIDALLDDFERSSEPAAAERAEELVRALVGLYGAGLDRIVAALRSAEGGELLLRQLTEDQVVCHLLLLHGLHPDDVDTRIVQALDRVRPYLGSHAGGVDYLGVDADSVAHLRLAGSCDGCPSSAATVNGAIEAAVLQAAPEVVRIEVEGLVAVPTKAKQLLQIGPCPVPQ